MSSDTDRSATPTQIGNALAVIATVTIGVAVERLLLSLGASCLVLRGFTALLDWWFVLDGGNALVNLWLSGVALILLTASLLHWLLRRKASTPDL